MRMVEPSPDDLGSMVRSVSHVELLNVLLFKFDIEK